MATVRARNQLVSNLGRLYGFYVAGFVAFFLLLALLSQVGVPDRIIGYLCVFFSSAVYIAIGILSRTMRISEFFVADRRVPTVYNGMAGGASWLSGPMFVSLAGSLYVLGYDGSAYILGWGGGFVLIAILIAPYLRKLGVYTLPDYFGARFGGGPIRLVAVVILVCSSLALLVAQLHVAGIIAARFLGMPYESGVLIGLIGVLFCTLLGGMRSATWSQIAQYIVLIAAYLVPLAAWSMRDTGLPVPQLAFGQALQQITRLEQALGVTAGDGSAATSIGQFSAHMAPFSSLDGFNFFALIVCLAIGTASMPHLLMRFFTSSTVRGARAASGWALLLVAVLLVSAPAYAAFVKLDILQNVVGKAVVDLPGWIFGWGSQGLELVRICGVAATGLDAVAAACGDADAILSAADIVIDRDIVLLAAPEIAGLPFVFTGMIAAGAVAAIISTASGLSLALAGAVSHDIYYRVVDRRAPTTRRLAAGRLSLILVVVGAGWLAVNRPADVLTMAAWAFSLAAAGNFPAMVLGIWWKRCTSAGALAGMVAGFGVTLGYLALIEYGGLPLLPLPGLTDGIEGVAAAAFGLPVGFAVTVLVSRATPAPPEAVGTLIDEMRRPRGETVIDPSQPHGYRRV